jgi:hypothetical protein
VRGARAQHSAAAGMRPASAARLYAAAHTEAQVMLRQAAEEKEAAIKMRAVLQAELAQKHPRTHGLPAASTVSTSLELDDSRLHLEAWAASQAIDDVMQGMLDELCPHRLPAPAGCSLAPRLQTQRVLQLCASMAAASQLLLQPVAAPPAEPSRSSQLAHERALAQAVAARDAALKHSAHLQEVP